MRFLIGARDEFLAPGDRPFDSQIGLDYPAYSRHLFNQTESIRIDIGELFPNCPVPRNTWFYPDSGLCWELSGTGANYRVIGTENKQSIRLVRSESMHQFDSIDGSVVTDDLWMDQNCIQFIEFFLFLGHRRWLFGARLVEVHSIIGWDMRNTSIEKSRGYSLHLCFPNRGRRKGRLDIVESPILSR